MQGVSEENHDTDDSRGSIVNLVDESGSAVVSYTYTDYGETAESQGGSFDNEIRFTGGVYDESTGLYYLNARFYDPASGRFLNPDSYRGEAADPQSLHLYAYCANNPINMVDPTGHTPETIIDVAFLGISVKEYLEAPSFTTFAYVAWDSVATIMPLMPGSYTARGVKYLTKADITDDLWKQGIRITSKGAETVKTAKAGKKVVKYVSSKKGKTYKPYKKVPVVIEIAKKKMDHVLTEHAPKRFAQQIEHKCVAKTKAALVKKTFFNKDWSEEKIKDAVKFTYSKALKAGIVNDSYSAYYAGEKITVYVDINKKLHSAYGSHHYTLSELMKLR